MIILSLPPKKYQQLKSYKLLAYCFNRIIKKQNVIDQKNQLL